MSADITDAAYQFDNGFPNQPQVAQKFGSENATMTRYLCREKTNFKDFIDDLYKEMAMDDLQTSH